MLQNKFLRILLKVIGVSIMLLAFVILPDSAPWYHEVLLFDLGLALHCLPKLIQRFRPTESTIV